MGREDLLNFVISGCAHCGNTLLIRCFFAFENMSVVSKETAYGWWPKIRGGSPTYEKVHGGKHVATKRGVDNLFNDVLSDEQILRALDVTKKLDLKHIVVIRDARDALLSTACKPLGRICRRWCAVMGQLQELSEYAAMIIRYEDIILKPDEVQQQIMDKYGLEAKARFSEYPDFVPDQAFVQYDKYGSSRKQYRKRPIDKDSLYRPAEKWKEVCPGQISQIQSFRESFGYA